MRNYEQAFLAVFLLGSSVVLGSKLQEELKPIVATNPRTPSTLPISREPYDLFLRQQPLGLRINTNCSGEQINVSMDYRLNMIEQVLVIAFERSQTAEKVLDYIAFPRRNSIVSGRRTFRGHFDGVFNTGLTFKPGEEYKVTLSEQPLDKIETDEMRELDSTTFTNNCSPI